MAISGSSMHNTCANQKIPSLFAVFVSPTLAFGKGDGRTSMKWRNITDVSLHELLPLCSLPAQSGLLSLRFFFSPSLSLHKRQMTSPNLISVAACEGLLLRLPVNRVCADSSAYGAHLASFLPTASWLLTLRAVLRGRFCKQLTFFLSLTCFLCVCVWTCLFMHELFASQAAGPVVYLKGAVETAGFQLMLPHFVCLGWNYDRGHSCVTCWIQSAGGDSSGGVTHPATQGLNFYCAPQRNLACV